MEELNNENFKAVEIDQFKNEADVLNVALFGMTAKEWHEDNLKLAKNLKVGDAFIYSAFNDKRYLSTVEPSTDKGKFCFDYIIACESHDEFFNIREHVMDKKVPLKDYSKNAKHKQQER